MTSSESSYLRLSEAQLWSLVNDALKAATDQATAEDITSNRTRSKKWIEALASIFDKYYASHSDVTVFRSTMPNAHFSRGKKARSEFLFDILVCSFGQFTSPVHKSTVNYIQCALLIVESEFAENTAESGIDFSKLVCGRAQQSLFVAPLKNPQHYLQTLAVIAPYVRGELYCALVPHPREWLSKELNAPKLYAWDPGTGWRSIISVETGA